MLTAGRLVRQCHPFALLFYPSSQLALRAQLPSALRIHKIGQQEVELKFFSVPLQLLKLLNNISVYDFTILNTTKAKHHFWIRASRQTLD